MESLIALAVKVRALWRLQLRDGLGIQSVSGFEGGVEAEGSETISRLL